ncbi:hypothetical protein BVX97_02660 [bacterium E08(2017)]|nr:hypothetical protein BVX97_02660 [bacterium E08(2017)]
MSALDETILSKLEKVSKSNGKYMACCPAHGDKNPSLSITEADDRLLLKCHAGCKTEDVVDALGLQMSDLFMPKPRGCKDEDARYKYFNLDGKLICTKVRYSDKSFSFISPDGKHGLKGADCPLYLLPDWHKDDTVFIVEGEKDANNLNKSLPVTTTPYGAGNYKDEYTPYFEGKTVYIVADNDKPGIDHAELIAGKVKDVAKVVKVLQFSDQSKGYDVSDWLRDNPEEDRFERLVQMFEDAPSWQPKRRFARHTINTLQGYQSNPQDYIAGDGFLRRGATCGLTGGTGMGKSVLVAQIAVSVASGNDILDCISVPHPRKVLVIQAENDEDTLKRDYISVADNMSADYELVEDNLALVNVFGVSGAEFAEVLEGAVREEKPDLIIIDPYQAYIGGTDINTTQSFLSWIEPVDRIVKEYCCALLLVAHTPKPKDRSDWNALQGVYMAAGTSAFANYLRTSCELLTAGQETSRFKLTFSKNPQRTGLRDEQFGGVLRELYIQHSDDPTQPYWAIAEDQTKPSTGKHDQKIRDYISQNPSAGDSEIAGVVGCDRSTVYRAKQRLGL